MIPRRLEEIEFTDLRMLIDNAVPESRTLEYKRELHGASSADRKEFCFDLSAFANANGGDILFGVEEDQNTHVASALPGIDMAVAEASIRAMEQRLISGVTPRMRVEFRSVELPNNRCVIISRIPPSPSAPHMTTIEGAYRFCVRDGSGKHFMDVEELRMIFTEQATRIERMRRWVDQRLKMISEGSDELPHGLSAAPKLVMHAIPLQAFMSGPALDLQDVTTANSVMQRQPFPGGDRAVVQNYNLDGVVYPSSPLHQERFGIYYAQIFHNGTIEIVDEVALRSDVQPPRIYANDLEAHLFLEMNWAARIYRRAQVQPPVYLFYSLLGVRGYIMGIDPQWHRRGRVVQNVVLQRNQVRFPDISLVTLDASPPVLLKPLIDQLWNGFGFSRALTYDEDGTYLGDWEQYLPQP